jgi:hypothetical protein
MPTSFSASTPGCAAIGRRPALAVLAALAVTALGGCATLNTVSSDVTSYAQWPAGRATAGTFSFERLPSQQAGGEPQARLEAAAARALAGIGFQPAPEGSAPDVRVQVGARVGRSHTPFLDDRLYAPYGLWAWPYGRGVFGWGPGWSTGLGWTIDSPRYDREVALLMRDGRTGTPLYETRAVSEGSGSFSNALLAALFEAALKDFPQPPAGQRTVRVTLPEESGAPSPTAPGSGPR